MNYQSVGVKFNYDVSGYSKRSDWRARGAYLVTMQRFTDLAHVQERVYCPDGEEAGTSNTYVYSHTLRYLIN